MSINIIIAVDQNVHDPLTMGETQAVSEIFRIAADVIANGGKVIIQRHYDNAPAEDLCVFTQQSDLSAWKERLNEAQVILGRDEIA